MLKVAVITTDNREQWKQYDASIPIFGTAPEALIEGLSLYPDEVEVHIISCTRRILNSPQSLAKNVHFHSVLIPTWGMMKSLYIGASFAIRDKLLQIRPDIVHGQGSEREAALAAVISGFPNLITLHGNMRLLAKFQKATVLGFLWFIAKIESYALKRTNGVICITHYTENLVKPVNNKTWLIPNAVDGRYFNVTPSKDAKRTLFLCVGLICPRKNQIFLIEALNTLRNEFSFELRFLGDTPSECEYGKTFHSLIKTKPWCSYAGFVSRDELANELERASALILPSLEDNCPMVILEAMAANVPVLASKVGGIPDLVTHGLTGTLFDPEDTQSIQSAVTNFLTDFPRASEMGKNAKQEALRRFHPSVIAGKHLEVYKSILSSAGEAYE